MPRYTYGLPVSEWPEDFRQRFAQHETSPAQTKRLRQGVGRWLKMADDLGCDPRDVTREAWDLRTKDLAPTMRNAIRQALALLFPKVAKALYAPDRAAPEPGDPRADLSRTIARLLTRFPEPWATAARPMLHIDALGIGDGLLVEAWAPSTIIRRLEAGAAFFDFCRRQGLPVDITVQTVRAKLRSDQEKYNLGKRRLGGMAAELMALHGLAAALHPGQSWDWLGATRDRFKKLSRAQMSRNAARAVNAAELRAAGQQLLDQADLEHGQARTQRAFIKAHTRARTALTMILLSEAPIRIDSCALLALSGGVLDDLSGIFLSSAQTKENDVDRRSFSRTLVDALRRYLDLHRPTVADPSETRLFVSSRGGPVKPSQLSKCLGDITEDLFRVRVTAHAVRHSVANFIVAAAPEEAALVRVVLNHKSEAQTPAYTRRADQITASHHLAASTRQAATSVSAEASVLKQPRKERPSRRRPAASRSSACTKSRALR